MDEIDPKSQISKYFTWKEALWLPRWDRMADESDGLNAQVMDSLKVLFAKMDVVREYFGAPIIVHVCYRPEEYNKLIGGAPQSAHRLGMAVDFSIKGISCDDARKKIMDEKMLEIWNMRMEDLPGSNWIHLDIRAPGPAGRFFKP